jgi:hypothetical protein
MAVLAQDPAALSRAFQREPLAAREGVAAALTSLQVRASALRMHVWGSKTINRGHTLPLRPNLLPPSTFQN